MRPREPFITTPDPAFDPHQPVIINGYRFVPGCRPYEPNDPRGAEALQIERDEQPAAADSRVGAFLAGIAFTLIALACGWGIAGWIGADGGWRT